MFQNGISAYDVGAAFQRTTRDQIHFSPEGFFKLLLRLVEAESRPVNP